MHILILDQEKMDAHLVSKPRFNAERSAFCFPDQEWIAFIFLLRIRKKFLSWVKEL
jgi:hypothetical protein